MNFFYGDGYGINIWPDYIHTYDGKHVIIIRFCSVDDKSIQRWVCCWTCGNINV